MPFRLRAGDLLFQDIHCGPGCDAITGVTAGWRGSDLNHVALYVGPESGGIVVEAIYPFVHYYTLERFLRRTPDDRGRPRVLVGRLKPARQALVSDALKWASGRIGLPYDRVFGSGEDAYYCSELIIDAFKYANDGAGLFEEHPMNFSDPGTGEVHPYWAAYFDVLGVPVPEGEVGSNPAALSLSPEIDIVHQFGDIRGLRLP